MAWFGVFCVSCFRIQLLLVQGISDESNHVYSLLVFCFFALLLRHHDASSSIMIVFLLNKFAACGARSGGGGDGDVDGGVWFGGCAFL